MTDTEIKLWLELFVFCEHNTPCEELKRLKAANQWFFDNKASVHKVCEMILKVQKEMFKILPPTKGEHYDKQFTRMNNLIKLCKETLYEAEKEKDSIA